MPFPDYPLEADKSDLTRTVGDHPAHHNALANAVNDLQDQVTALDFTGIAETIRDTVADTLVAGTNVTITVDDVANTITIDATGGGADLEAVRDDLATVLTAGDGIDITVDDVANTITIAVEAAYLTSTEADAAYRRQDTPLTVADISDAGDAATRDVGTTAGTVMAGDDARVTGIAETIRDTIGSALVAGNNLDITVNDAGDTITIDVEALTSADISDLAETIRDTIGTALVAGDNIAVTVDDVANTITLAVSGLTLADISDAGTAASRAVATLDSDPDESLPTKLLMDQGDAAMAAAGEAYVDAKPGHVRTFDVPDATDLPAEWTQASDLYPTEFAVIGVTDRKLHIVDETVTTGYPASFPAIGAAWQDWGSGWDDEFEVAAIWTGIWPFEGTPLIHVTPGTAKLGIGAWPYHDLTVFGISAGPTLGLGYIANPPDNFDPIENTPFDHIPGRPRIIMLRSSGGSVSAWMDDLDTGEMYQVGNPITIDPTLVGSTSHGLAIDSHYATPSYPMSGQMTGLAQPDPSTAVLQGPWVLRHTGEDHFMSGPQIDQLMGVRLQAAQSDPAPFRRIIDAADDTIGSAPVVGIDNSTGSLIVLTSTPSIPAGTKDGERKKIVNIGPDPVTIQGEDDLAGTNVQMTRTLIEGKTVTLTWSETLGLWIDESHPGDRLQLERADWGAISLGQNPTAATRPRLGLRKPGDAEDSVALGYFLDVPLIGMGLGSAAADTFVSRSAAGQVASGIGGGDVFHGGDMKTLNTSTANALTVAAADRARVIDRAPTAAATQTWPQDSAASIPIGVTIRTKNRSAYVITHSAGTGATLMGHTTQAPGEEFFTTKTAANTWHSVGTNGDRYANGWAQVGTIGRERVSLTATPTGVFYENMERLRTPITNTSALTSGTILGVIAELLPGDVVSSITLQAATTAAGTPTNQWAGLVDNNRVVRAISADATSAAWASNTDKTFTMTTPYTVPADGAFPYYVIVMVAATTVPTLFGHTPNANVSVKTPRVIQHYNTGQTTPPAVSDTLIAPTSPTLGVPWVRIA